MNCKLSLAAALAGYIGLSAQDVLVSLEAPPNPALGDYAFPCFRLAKVMRKAPQAIAAELSTKAYPGFIEKAVATGSYLNFFMDKGAYCSIVLKNVLSDESYGSSGIGAGETVCIDFSSINIAKPFHIGHLSSTVIGAALYRLYKYLGYRCVGINHLGDWGTQFGKLIVAYKRWGDRKAIEQDSVDALMKIYVKFHEEAEKDPSLEEEARFWFKKIEDGDGEAVALHAWFKELTLKEAAKVYDMLGITFDSYDGESFFNDKMDRVVCELRNKNLLLESQGAYVVNLDEFSLPPCMILKSDGATLYATRDIAAALYRKDTYGFSKCLYVVAYQQNLHFAQWFKVIELMGYDWADELEHVNFGMVSMEEGTLSTRKGNVVLLKDVLERAVEKTLGIINEKSPALENKQETAKQVGIGAVVFHTLSNNRIKDIVFSFDRVLNFDGETGPYVQYTHARSCSVLLKSSGYENPDCTLLKEDEALVIAKQLDNFLEVLIEAARKNEPSLIARHLIDLAQAYNRYYYEYRILEEDPALAGARLALTDAVRKVIKIGLGLLGIAAPAKM
ncbi:MAG: arginine--tRNA ligase [Christensenellales bacterium]